MYGGFEMYQQQQQMMPQGPSTCDVFVEILPEVQPNFGRGPNGCFVMEMPPIRLRMQTTCSPALPQIPGLSLFKPYEEFWVQFPELQRVIFDPNTGNPPNGMVSTSCQKSGAILECPRNIALNAQCKANSPYGSLILEDIQSCGGCAQKVGETALNYRLQVEAAMQVNNGGGNMGANRLEVMFQFFFHAQVNLGGSAIAQGAGCPY
jgi:hypothetical protein